MTSLGASALSDEFTALSYAQSVRQARAQALFWAFMLTVFAISFGLWIGAPENGPMVLLAASASTWVVLVVAMFVYPAMLLTVTWRPATRSLLDQPWREAAMRVLNTKGTKLFLTDGEYIQVKPMPAAAREVIVRAGRVWLVGPDADGRLAVRVDGLLTAWPARRIPPLQATAALPTTRSITDIWLGPLAASVQLVLAVMLAVSAVLQMGVALLADRNWASFLLWSALLGFAVTRWITTYRVRRMRPTGTWSRAEATVSSWRVGWNGVATGTVDLVLPDGRGCTAHVRCASVDLFANVRHEKALWVAGNGVVGFPHYPVLAVATFTP